MAQNGLSSAQQRTIVALLSTRTATEAAAVAGVGLRSVTRWLADPTFRTHLAQAESDLVDHAMRRLLNLQGQAIETLAGALHDPHATVRVRAAGMILDYSLRLRDVQSIEQRLAALEAAQEAKSDKEA